MTAWGYSRGHRVQWNGEAWVYSDTGEIDDHKRPCVQCHQPPTVEGYDACLGYLPGVGSACCGHGVEDGYIVRKTTNYGGDDE